MTTATPDDIIHQIVRLKIMAALTAPPAGEMLEFIKLRAIIAASDGNLATHLNTLDAAGYIEVKKDYIGKKPRTRIRATPTGRDALARHVQYLRAIIDNDAPALTLATRAIPEPVA